MSTEVDPASAESFRTGWAEYVRRRNFLLFVFVGHIPWGLLVMLLERRLGFSDWIAGALTFVWFLTFPVAAIRYAFWKCARCGKTFAYRWPVNKSYFARKCSHCGLGKSEISRIAREPR
jgi:DNA-directed RNA polymerase subunit RPC12/RpoP